MKIRKIYRETESIEDLSKDRVHLDLSYGEWQKLKTLIEMASWNLYEVEKHTQYLRKLAKNVKTTFENAEEIVPIWLDKEGVALK